jgi:hypothetical protein
LPELLREQSSLKLTAVTLLIHQQLSLGFGRAVTSKRRESPLGDERRRRGLKSEPENSGRPYGTCSDSPSYPALKRWAIIRMPRIWPREETCSFSAVADVFLQVIHSGAAFGLLFNMPFI